MPFQVVETYWNISEKAARISQIYEQARGKAVFLVPSGMDKDPLLQMVSGCGSFMGERPPVWTWSDFYDHCARAGDFRKRRVIDPPDHTLILDYILKNYLAEAQEKGAALPPGVAQPGFAGVLGDNIHELLNEEVFPQQMRETLAFGDTDETPESILCELYSRYLDYLAENGLADSAQLPTLTREAIVFDAKVDAFIKEHMFVCVGFLSFTGGQRNLIQLLKDTTNAIFILPETGIDDFYDAIRQIDEQYARRPQWSVNVARIQAGNIQQQFYALARELALWASGQSRLAELGPLADYGEVGVQVLPEHLRKLQNAFARYKIPYNTQVRESVVDTLLGGLPRLLWNAYRSGWETKKTALLLASPLFGDVAPDAAALAGALPEGEKAWRALLSGNADALKIFQSLNQLCESFEQGGAPLQVMELWRDFAQELKMPDKLAGSVDDEYALDQVVKDASSVLSELDKKIEALRDLKRDIGAAANIQLRGSAAAAFISDWGADATLPIQLPQSRSVTVYAGAPPVLSSHPYWVMTDVDYNNWPGTLRESPLLSGDHKKLLNEAESDAPFHSHLPELHEKRQQKEALFRRLIATAEQGVILTRSMTDAQKRRIEESQFVAALRASSEPRSFTLPEPVAYPLAKMIPSGEDPVFAAAEVPFEQPEILFGAYPRAGSSTAGPEKTYISISSVDSWIGCPYFYWCEKKLRLERPKRGLFDPMSAGNFTHDVWEQCWKENGDGAKSLVTLANKHWESSMQRKYPELATDPRLARQRLRLRKQVMDLAEAQDRANENMRGRLDVTSEFTVADYEYGGVLFRGRADRIDLFEDGFVVLDYKSNAANQHKEEMQPAVYCAILQRLLGKKAKGYAWLGLRDAKTYGYFEDEDLKKIYAAGSPKENNFGAQLEKAEQIMKEMAEAVLAGSYPAIYSTGGEPNKMCKSCPYSALCRRRGAPGSELEALDEEETGGGFDA